MNWFLGDLGGIFGDLWGSWGILGDLGESWGILEDLGGPWGILGDLKGTWVILGDLGNLRPSSGLSQDYKWILKFNSKSSAMIALALFLCFFSSVGPQH